jgi:hypothetical protein
VAIESDSGGFAEAVGKSWTDKGAVAASVAVAVPLAVVAVALGAGAMLHRWCCNWAVTTIYRGSWLEVSFFLVSQLPLCCDSPGPTTCWGSGHHSARTKGGADASTVFKGTVQPDFHFVFWYTLIGLGLNMNRFWFLNFSETPTICQQRWLFSHRSGETFSEKLNFLENFSY